MLGDKFEKRIIQTTENNETVYRVQVLSQIRNKWLSVYKASSLIEIEKYFNDHNLEMTAVEKI